MLGYKIFIGNEKRNLIIYLGSMGVTNKFFVYSLYLVLRGVRCYSNFEKKTLSTSWIFINGKSD